MSSKQKKSKLIQLPGHQSGGFDSFLSVGPDDSNQIGQRMPLHRIKHIDTTDSTEVRRSVTDLDEKSVKGKDRIHNLADRIKSAAIYDDEVEIIQILSSETNGENVQRILGKNDERGRPCIFYALESRSRNALARILHHIRRTECIIAENGETVLHVATKIGEVDILRYLLEQDIVANMVNDIERKNKRAPLHLAAKFNYIEIAKELLQHGAKLDRPDITGQSPLYMAACGGYADMLKVFLEHEKDKVNFLLFDSSFGDRIYRNIFHVAVGSGDEKSVQVCLNQDPEIVREYFQSEIKHGDGYLIHSACKNGMEKCLLRIVECMEDSDTLQLNRKDESGFTPIHNAAVNNHANLVGFVGSMSEQFVNETTNNSQTALLLAVQSGHIKVVEKLLELKADFTISDDRGVTVLHYAIAYPDLLTVLLKKRDLTQLLINKKKKDGCTPVHYAASQGLCDSVRILLEYGADLNVFTNKSRSPLHYAVISQCSDVVELILANKPALINKADATGKTPLHTAASYGSAEIVECLLNNGASILKDGDRSSALHIASSKGHLSIVEMLVAFDKNIIDCENKYSRTPLLTAALTCKTDIVKFLLDNNAKITEDHDFFNCLDWSIIKNDKQSAMVMMNHERWKEIMVTTKHGTEGTMAKLVSNMPEVAYRALSNSMTSVGHPDTKEHLVQYDFMCLQNLTPPGDKRAAKLKPLTAIKAMLKTNCYSCLCHPVCCKYLKAKWMDFGWKIYSVSLIIYLLYLISLNVYAFNIPTYEGSKENKGERLGLELHDSGLPPELNQRGDFDASINVKVAMIICLIFASLNALKEIAQLLVYKLNFFMDKVNYMECVLYVSTFIFAVPVDGKVAVKNSVQWKACSVALFCAWINLVMYLRRFASYGIIILMMRKISATLLKVMGLLIFFLFAFAAAFRVIMNDREGFQSFGVSMLTGATMTMGEFDFKETFLKDTYEPYSTFYWLRIIHLIAFLIVMPIIIMNLLLALAIDDTSKIMQRAKLQKHIQTAKMIIDMERKSSRFYWKSSRLASFLVERPNKTHDFSRTIWEYIFYGPDFSSEKSGNRTNSGVMSENMGTLLDTMKELQRQITVLQNEFTSERNRRCREVNRSNQDKQHTSREFRGYSESIEGSFQGKPNVEWKRKAWGGGHRGRLSTGIKTSGAVDLGDIILSAKKDVFDDKEGENRENDSELKKLKELYDSELDYDDFDGNKEYRQAVYEKADVGIGKENEVFNDDEISPTPVHDENESATGMTRF